MVPESAAEAGDLAEGPEIRYEFTKVTRRSVRYDAVDPEDYGAYYLPKEALGVDSDNDAPADTIVTVSVPEQPARPGPAANAAGPAHWEI